MASEGTTSVQRKIDVPRTGSGTILIKSRKEYLPSTKVKETNSCCLQKLNPNKSPKWMITAMIILAIVGLGVAGAGAAGFFAQQQMLPAALAKLNVLGAVGHAGAITMMAGGGVLTLVAIALLITAVRKACAKKKQKLNTILKKTIPDLPKTGTKKVQKKKSEEDTTLGSPIGSPVIEKKNEEGEKSPVIKKKKEGGEEVHTSPVIEKKEGGEEVHTPPVIKKKKESEEEEKPSFGWRMLSGVGSALGALIPEDVEGYEGNRESTLFGNDNFGW